MFGLYRSRNKQQAAASAARIHAACFPKAWDESYFACLLENPATAIFFAREEDADIAFITLQIVAGEAEILTLGVVPEQQRQGIASGLLWFAEKALGKEAVTRIFLEVSDVNLPAQKLYSSLQYKELSRRPGYYADGSAAICLAKDLTPAGALTEAIKRD